MNDVDQAVILVAEMLKDSEAYPWKTARYLSERLRKKKGCNIDPKTLEKVLLDNAQLPDRQVRYSFFPARKTLDLLWGHVRNVNDFEALPDPHLDLTRDFVKAVGEFEPCKLSDDAPWCFLSHNFRDLEVVRKIREDLLSRGYGVWMAEAEIFHGDMITQKVQEGLERADRFVMYMSRRSLGSRWVLKEASVAINHWHLPPTVVLDGKDPALNELFQPWLAADWNNAWLAEHIDQLLTDANEEPAAIMLPVLLIGALQGVPREKRHVVTYPEQDHERRAEIQTFDEAFPKQNPHANIKNKPFR